MVKRDQRAPVTAARITGVCVVFAALIGGAVTILNPPKSSSLQTENGGVINLGDQNVTATNGGLAAGGNLTVNTNEGKLSADTQPTPEHECFKKFAELSINSSPENSLTVILGNSLSVGDVFPMNVLTVGGEALIVIDKDPDTGGLVIKTLRIFDVDGNRIAQVVSDGQVMNEYFAATASFIRFRKSDNGHEFTVYDRRDRRVLSLHYLNKSTLSIQGVFRNAGREFIIDADKITVRSQDKEQPYGQICLGPSQSSNYIHLE